MVNEVLKHLHKCVDCSLCQEQYLTTLRQQGVYRFSYCSKRPNDLVMVEPNIPRYCINY